MRRRPSTCCCLLLHHIAGDGWSLSPLWRDLAAFYLRRGYGAGVVTAAGSAVLPALPVQYADYTLWQQAVLGDESDRHERAVAPAGVLAGPSCGPAGAAGSAVGPCASCGCEPPWRVGGGACCRRRCTVRW